MARTVSTLAAAVLSACTAPQTHFYTLGTDGQPAKVRSTARPAFRIDMRPVKVPAAVARNQLVVQTNAGQVQMLEDDRWASPLADEIRYALIADVSQQASAAGVQGSEARARDKAADISQPQKSEVREIGYLMIKRSRPSPLPAQVSILNAPRRLPRRWAADAPRSSPPRRVSARAFAGASLQCAQGSARH